MAAMWVGEVGKRPLGFCGDVEWALVGGAPGGDRECCEWTDWGGDIRPC